MGAKLAKPDKLCINVWGDAAIGFTGMDFETAVRERIPIMSILLNNFSMAIELKVMRSRRKISLDRHLRRLRRDGARLRRLWRTGDKNRKTSSRRSSAALPKPGKAFLCCWSSSPPRRPRSQGPHLRLNRLVWLTF